MESSTESSYIDLNIKYDAVKKLAYNQRRERYEKGDFVEDLYDLFRENYGTLVVSNDIATKARESGEECKKLEMNESTDTVSIESSTEYSNIDLTGSLLSRTVTSFGLFLKIMYR